MSGPSLAEMGLLALCSWSQMQAVGICNDANDNCHFQTVGLYGQAYQDAIAQCGEYLAGCIEGTKGDFNVCVAVGGTILDMLGLGGGD